MEEEEDEAYQFVLEHQSCRLLVQVLKQLVSSGCPSSSRSSDLLVVPASVILGRFVQDSKPFQKGVSLEIELDLGSGMI